jgi:hypothetical protein
MSERFDPYHVWLGIPADEQPADHYRLLGVRRLESNEDVIINAADQRMAFLRTFQAGKHSRESQNLLNEIAVAQACLLDPAKKHTYDEQLRIADGSRPAVQAPTTVIPPPVSLWPPPVHSMPHSVSEPANTAPLSHSPAPAVSPNPSPMYSGIGAIHAPKTLATNPRIRSPLGVWDSPTVVVMAISLVAAFLLIAASIVWINGRLATRDATSRPVAAATNATPAAPRASTPQVPTPGPGKLVESAPTPEPAKPAAEPTSELAKPAPPKPEPTKPELAKNEPAKPAADKPAAAATAMETFKSLPTAVSLPKLEPGMTDPSPNALASLVIGHCLPGATALLKGGGNAIRDDNTMFQLMEVKDEQLSGKWDVVMTVSQTPLTIAQFSVQNEQLTFQWTPKGAMHESASYLSNCKLVLSAGTDQHEISLRKPLNGKSLLVDLEKPGSTVKWTVEHLPDPRKVVVEISRLGEAFPAHKFDPSPAMEGISDESLIWIGTDPENVVLGIKFESSQTAKAVQVKATAQFKQGSSTKPLLPRTLKSIQNEIDQKRLALIQSEKLLTNQTGGNDQQKKSRETALKTVKQQQNELNVQGEQFNQLQQLIAELKDRSEVHFRVYYEADDSQVDLVVTDAAPAKEKRAAPKPDAGKAKK